MSNINVIETQKTKCKTLIPALILLAVVAWKAYLLHDTTSVAGIQKAVLTVYCQSKIASPMRISTAGIETYNRQALIRKLAQVLSMAYDRCES